MLYCWVVVLLPLCAIPSLIALGRSDFFLHHGASVWVQANDRIFDDRDRDCDLLVFGDSTAMTGIDPERVQQQTGLKTCNIAVTNAVLAVTGNLTLDHFLAHNHRPKVLLVQLSPDGFQPESSAWHRTIYAEGMLELLRHGKPEEARGLLLHHPEESVAFAGYAAGFTAWYGIKEVWFRITHLRPEEDRVTVRNGFFSPKLPPRTSCTPSNAALAVFNTKQIEFSRRIVANFHQDYDDRSGIVLVNVSPIPDCNENLAAYSAQLRGVTANPLLPMPIRYFNDCCHFTASGSEIVSALVANEVNSVASQDRATTHRPASVHQIAALHRLQIRR